MTKRNSRKPPGTYFPQALKKTILHAEGLSPDPTCGKNITTVSGNVTRMDMFPHQVVRACPDQESVAIWADQLDAFKPCPPLVMKADCFGRIDVVLDFGAELDGALELDVTTSSLANLMVTFGETDVEAEGMVFSQIPKRDVHWHIPRAGTHRHVFDKRGFRYVRLLFNDIDDSVAINNISVHADFTFTRRDGDFRCSDSRFQRLWQTSAYTARLCTRPDSLWDGIKRDRIGWFGDARITKEATDNVFFDPRPAEALMETLPVNNWANGIPNYSFDAIAMLRQHILTYGLERQCVAVAYGLIKQFLQWVGDTQVNEDGFIKRTDLNYFFEIGFLDWSPMPVGGRFEELSWLQCKYLEGLKDAVVIAGWLNRQEDTAHWSKLIKRLEKTIIEKFWRDGAGFVHTLNHVGDVPNRLLPGYDGHYKRTYVDQIRLGESGPSRQSNALAVFAGLCTDEMKRVILKSVFNNPQIPSVITPYFSYFEQVARAHCGDRYGALMAMRDYVGAMIEREDASTVWELYDSSVQDMRKYSSHFDTNWICPLSMCHGWGSGAIPITTACLLGIQSVKPGYREITINPTATSWLFEAAVPTPLGTISVNKDAANGKVFYTVPKGVKVNTLNGETVEIR